MTEQEAKIQLTPAQFAHLGEGSLAYMRLIDSEELAGKFPGIPEIQPGLKLWALFAANGRPIMLTDERSNALQSAIDNDLIPVALH